MKRRVGLFSVVGVILPLVVATSASAQGSTMRLDPQAASPGQVITATGGSFSSSAGASAVSIRLSTRDGQVLAQATPNTRGQIEARFPLPSVSPGTYLVLATQTVNGRQRAFTPARTTLVVKSSAAGAAIPPGGGSTGEGPPSVVPLAGILALILLAAGSTITVRRIRTTLNRPLGN